MRNLTQIKLQTSIKNKFLIAGAALALLCQPALAEERTIDISGNNKSDDYKSYSTAISIPAGDIVNVKMTKNEAKYPVDKARGSNKKYTEL